MLLLLKGTVAGDYLIRCLGSTANLKCGTFFFFAGKLLYIMVDSKGYFEMAKTFSTPKLS
jgi:hypothetical protein